MGRTKLTVAVCGVLLLGAVGLSVFGQAADPAIEELKRQVQQARDALLQQQAVIEALQQRISDLERVQQAGAKAPPVAIEGASPAAQAVKGAAPSFSAAWKDGKTSFTFPGAELVLSNRVQARYLYDDFQDPDLTDTGAFSIRRFKTSITGWAYTKDLTFRLQMDWANANSTLGVLDDAWVQYDFTHGKKWFMLRAGQGKTPFARQALASTATDMFADRSTVTLLFTSIRDVGLMASGQFGPASVPDLVEYGVGVFNGSGRSVYTNARNQYKTDYRLVLSPWGSAGYDEANPNGTPEPRLSLGVDYESNDRRVRDSKTGLYKSGAEYGTTGYDLMFKYKWFTAYGEYFDRRSHDILDKVTDSTGLNAQLGFLLIPRRLEVFLGRWDYDPDSGKTASSQRETGIGAAWYFKGFNNKLQADLRRLDNDVTRYHSYEFRLQYQLIF